MQGGGDPAECHGSFPMKFLGKTNLQGMAFGQLAELFRAHLASLQLLRQDLPVCSRSRFAERFHKAITVPVVEDNVFAAISTAQYVIPGSLALNSHWPWHPPFLPLLNTPPITV